MSKRRAQLVKGSKVFSTNKAIIFSDDKWFYNNGFLPLIILDFYLIVIFTFAYFEF